MKKLLCILTCVLYLGGGGIVLLAWLTKVGLDGGDGWFLSLLMAALLTIGALCSPLLLYIVWWRIFTPEGREAERKAQHAWNIKKAIKRDHSIFNVPIPVEITNLTDTAPDINPDDDDYLDDIDFEDNPDDWDEERDEDLI